MRFTSDEARSHLDAVLAVLDRTVIGLDFDGTLSPVVDDPEQAWIHPDAHAALAGLAGALRAVAVVTGRPVAQVLHLGSLDDVAGVLIAGGTDVQVFGQYGAERWSGADRGHASAETPAGLAAFGAELPEVLRTHDATEAWIEDKGLALAVHTRRMTDGAAAFERLSAPLAELAARHGLHVEPGRQVIEVRAGDSDKGQALRTLVEEQRAGGVIFVGDDLGDLPAFEAVRTLRDRGLPGLVVCSASEEQPVLAEQADVVVDGPDGVVHFLRHLVSTS
jgi:trehalose 6-phosphate phosphatase